MTSFWSKLNHNLSAVYQLYLHEPQHGAPAIRVPVSMLYEGKLAWLEALGFRTHSSSAQRAVGYVDLVDLEQLAAHPDVVHLAVESVLKPTLVTSVPSIGVAGSVWTRNGDRFDGITGEGVIIGIIDSGIDFTHTFFFKAPETEPPKTRILRIWDQILVPGPGEKRPEADLLKQRDDEVIKTYGVEYTDEQIDKALTEDNPRRLIRHHDRDGHGTCVAAVAAGNGGKDRALVGVAPGAQLVVVNLGAAAHPDLSPETPPSPYDRLKHAVNYILNVAKAANKAVVINMSLADHIDPHDGRSSDELFLSERFAGLTGKAFVVGAGNAGGGKLHARVKFRRRQKVTLKVELLDELTIPSSNRSASVNLYYPLTATLVEFKVSRGPDWVVTGQALGQDPPRETPRYREWKLALRHATEKASTPSGSIIDRCNAFNFNVDQNALAYMPEGIFTIELTLDSNGDVDAEAHVICSDVREGGTGFTILSGEPTANVAIEERYLIGPPGGARDVFTVAMFDHRDNAKPVIARSSRGPVARYGGPEPPGKPDIAAPGRQITTARSSEAKPFAKIFEPPPFRPSTPDVQTGTSISAPYVAGVIALLFKLKSDLSYEQLTNALTPGPVPMPRVRDEAFGIGRLNGRKAVDKVNAGDI